MMPTFYEFFAGGGMARIGLGKEWKCEFANDISPVKAAAYKANFPDSNHRFVQGDINHLSPEKLPGKADLIWGSFPCQDLSLAGAGRGLSGARSGLVWSLLELGKALAREGRGPKVFVLENVTGLLNANDGEDFYEILYALRREGFLFGAMMLDAVHFLPQSRPRVFLVAIDVNQIAVKPRLIGGRAYRKYLWTSPRLDRLWRQAPPGLRDSWLWWNLPVPQPRSSTLTELIEAKESTWDSREYTERLIGLMSPLHQRKVEQIASLGTEVVGTLYRRTRMLDGERTQRVEVRFDGISGCLRTPSGGSSRQRLLFVNGNSIRSRLLSSREAARLMGIPDSYILPESYNDGYQIAGDGVAVPVVRWLSKHLLLPLLSEKGTPLTQSEVQLLYA